MVLDKELKKISKSIDNAKSVKEIRKIGKKLSKKLVTENYSKKLERLVDKLVKKSSQIKKKGGQEESDKKIKLQDDLLENKKINFFK